MWTLGQVTSLHASWRCPGQERSFLLSVDTYSRDSAALRQIASRVFSTLRCNDDTAHVPAFVMPAPEGFSSTWGIDLAPEEVTVPAEIAGNVAPTTVRAAPIPRGIVESDERTIYEQHDADSYRIAAVWHCYTLGIDVAIYANAPPTRPRESLLAAISGAHCPR